VSEMSTVPGEATSALTEPTATAPLFISIIVPVRNEAKFIERTLHCLLSQDYDAARFEVLVIDGESSDRTADIVARMARQHLNLRLLHNPRRLSSAARNVGIRYARGDVVLLVDGHCELKDREHLRRLASAFERSSADAVGRPQPLDITGATAFQRALAAARSSRLGHHPDSFIYSSQERFVPAKSVAVAYRRGLFDRVGLFDETFDACEDVELNHRLDRAGLRCYFVPELAVHYVPRSTVGGLFHQMVRYGRGRMRLLRKHPETFSLKSFLPAFFVIGLFGGLAAMGFSQLLAVVYAAVLATYVTIVLAVSGMQVAARRDLALLPWLPLVFATIHLASGVGSLAELCCPSHIVSERHSTDAVCAQSSSPSGGACP
jgi:succinoglycan biosynthesis protein ExoA